MNNLFLHILPGCQSLYHIDRGFEVFNSVMNGILFKLNVERATIVTITHHEKIAGQTGKLSVY